MEKNIGIIGGDLRTCMLAKVLAEDGYKVHTYAIEQMKVETKLKEKIMFYEEIESLANNIDIIISSIPLSKDENVIYTPFSKKTVYIDELFEKIEGKKFIAGAMAEYVYDIAHKNNIEIIDILKEEEMAVLNAIPTAEGAIQIAMEESEITIHDSNCLILGFGRIGKILAKMLNGIGARVYCEARKEEDLAWIDAYGYNKVILGDLDKNLKDYDYIFNTIPYMILDEKRLGKIKKECLIIELASKPYGVDFEKAKEKEIKVILAPGLPGKVAPLTSARYIQKVIYKLM